MSRILDHQEGVNDFDFALLAKVYRIVLISLGGLYISYLLTFI